MSGESLIQIYFILRWDCFLENFKLKILPVKFYFHVHGNVKLWLQVWASFLFYQNNFYKRWALTRPDPSLLLTRSNNKRPTRLWPGYFLTRPEEIFFAPKGKKLKNLTFLGEIFKIQTQTINGWPDPTRVKNFWPGPITNFYQDWSWSLSSSYFSRFGVMMMGWMLESVD